MTSSNDPSRPANQDDPWEQLAEDLFGLEYGKEHAAREPAPPVAEVVPSPAIEPPPSARAMPKKEYVEPSTAFAEPPRFASEAVADVKPPLVDPAVVDSDGDNDEPVGSDAPRDEAAAEPASAEPVSPQDSYWDALANWNWDESEGGSGKPRSESRPSEQRRPEQRRSQGGPPSRGGSRGRDEGRGRRGGDRPERQATAPPAASPPAVTPAARPPRPTEPAASDDFGLGLESGAPGFSAPAGADALERKPGFEGRGDDSPSAGGLPPTATESSAERSAARGGDRSGQRPAGRSPEAGKEGEFPRKRRRRRRRRGGRGGEGGSGDDSREAAASVPGSDWGDSDGPEKDLPDDESEPVTEDAGTAAAGESDAEHPASDVRGRREGRRSEERPHSAISSSEESPFDDDDEPLETVLDGGGAGDSESDFDNDEGDGDDESGDEQTVSYENIPTWEEAIAYLLHPNQVQVEPGTGSGGPKPPRGAPPADQPRQTRHIGHRKHRR